MDELELGIRTMEGLLKKVQVENWEFRPANNMRNLKELAQHIVSIPEVDLFICMEKDQETIQEVEARYNDLESSHAMIKAMHKGFDLYEAYMLALSEEDFLTKKTKPFYLDEGEIQAHWLIE